MSGPYSQPGKEKEEKWFLYGKIVLLKRSGEDGADYPVAATSCLFGRSNDRDIQIKLSGVSESHCRMDVNADAEVFITNFSSESPCLLNQKIE